MKSSSCRRDGISRLLDAFTVHCKMRIQRSAWLGADAAYAVEPMPACSHAEETEAAGGHGGGAKLGRASRRKPPEPTEAQRRAAERADEVRRMRKVCLPVWVAAQ